MSVVIHASIFALSLGTIWFMSGMLIDATNTVAHRYNKPGFAIAFFVLGFLTSISELSVATNATLDGIPQVSAGNLLGASPVIILLIIPLLAVLGNGVAITRALRPSNLAILLGIVGVPSLLALDGRISFRDGIIMLLLYATLIYRIRKKVPPEQTAADALRRTEQELVHTKKATAFDIGKIALGGIMIFIAGGILVEESVYFARLLHIPVSVVGLLLLSIGTNLPELVIAIRCILSKHSDIALGDYMGSAAANTLIFAFLPIANGTFQIEANEARVTFAVFAVGLVLFFVFSQSKSVLSRREGSILLALYAVFVVLQIVNAIQLSKTMPDEQLKLAAPDLILSRNVICRE